MKVFNKIEWMQTRYEIELKQIQRSLATVSKYSDKTPEDAQKMFDAMPPVKTYRRNGWLNEEERWAIAFYAQKLPRRTSRKGYKECALHLYEIAAKFACSLPTVYKYARYEG